MRRNIFSKQALRNASRKVMAETQTSEVTGLPAEITASIRSSRYSREQLNAAYRRAKRDLEDTAA